MARKKAEAEETVAAEKTSKGATRIQKLLASEAFQKLKKKHGKLILTTGSDARVAKSFRIPSGVFQIDKALGGGWPQGRVNVIYGMKSSCKTTLLLKTIAEAQRMCSNCWEYVRWSKQLDVPGEKKKQWVEDAPVRRWYSVGDKWRELLSVETDEDGNQSPVLGDEIRPLCGCSKYREAVCAFLDVEGTFDKSWAARHGLDLDKLLLSIPEYAEQSLDMADALVRSGDVDVLVLDSIAFLTPAKEIEESSEKETMGGVSKLMGRGTRKFVSGLNMVALHSERRPTIFLTNQIRMKIGVMFGNPETQPGGYAPGFAASVEVKTKPGKYEFDKSDEDHPIPIEVEVPFDIEKNKTAPPKMSGSFKMVLIDGTTKKLGDVYDEDEVLEEAVKHGIVTKEGGWACLGTKYDSKSKIEQRLRTDRQFYRLIKQTLLKLIAMPVEDLGLQPVMDGESSESADETEPGAEEVA